MTATTAILICVFVVLAIIACITLAKSYYIDTFITNTTATATTTTSTTTIATTTTDQQPTQQIDRTRLYGSLFMDKMNEVIQNMTSPRLKYTLTPLTLNDYADVIQ